jgi:hypothetical protein
MMKVTVELDFSDDRYIEGYFDCDPYLLVEDVIDKNECNHIGISVISSTGFEHDVKKTKKKSK